MSTTNHAAQNESNMYKTEDFWNWFKADESKYYYLNQINNPLEKDQLLEMFLFRLHLYCDKLYFEIGGMTNEHQELIISTEGNKDYFYKVEALVDSAPMLDEWIIIAFKPPMGSNFITEYQGLKLDPKEIWFLPLENEKFPEALGLRVCFPNFKENEENVYLEGCYQVLDVLLGEKSVAIDVHHVEVGKLPKEPVKEGLMKLAELPKFISWRNSKQ